MELSNEYEPKPDDKRFHLRMPPDLFEWYRQEAEENNRSITGQFVYALRDWQKLRKTLRNED